jgi:hypothetical protein
MVGGAGWILVCKLRFKRPGATRSNPLKAGYFFDARIGSCMQVEITISVLVFSDQFFLERFSGLRWGVQFVGYFWVSSQLGCSGLLQY